MHSSIFGKLPAEQIESLYTDWKNDPRSVPMEWNAYFEGYELGKASDESCAFPVSFQSEIDETMPMNCPITEQGSIAQLIRAYRVVGHQFAQFNPLEEKVLPEHPIPLEELGIDPLSIDDPINSKQTLRTLVEELKATYCSTIGFEYLHITNWDMRLWIEDQIKEWKNKIKLTNSQKIHALTELI